MQNELTINQRLAIAVLQAASLSVIEHALAELSAMRPIAAKQIPAVPTRASKSHPPKLREGSESVRRAVQRILQTVGKITRRDLMARIAAERQISVSESLEKNIDDAIRRDDSGCIRRIGRGLYTYVEE